MHTYNEEESRHRAKVLGELLGQDTQPTQTNQSPFSEIVSIDRAEDSGIDFLTYLTRYVKTGNEKYLDRIRKLRAILNNGEKNAVSEAYRKTLFNGILPNAHIELE